MADEDAPPVETPDSVRGDAGNAAPPATGDSAAELKRLSDELARTNQRFHDTQAAFTKASQDAAVARAEAELLKSQANRGVSAEVADREQAAFDERWKRDLAEDPGKAVEFFRGTANELRQSVESKVEKELERLRNELRDVRETSSPDYHQNREAVDQLRKDYPGLSREDAVKLAKQLKAASTPAPQQRAQIPGRSGGGAVAGGEDEARQQVEVPANILQTWRDLGLDEAEMRKTLSRGGK